MAKIEQPSTLVRCDICHKDFILVKECLTESKVVLNKEELDPKEVVLTALECPCCGKTYPIMLDNEETLAIVKQLTSMYQRNSMLCAKGRKVPAKLVEKYKQLERKLGFKRSQLAQKYNKSVYQSPEGETLQLEFRHHGRDMDD